MNKIFDFNHFTNLTRPSNVAQNMVPFIPVPRQGNFDYNVMTAWKNRERTAVLDVDFFKKQGFSVDKIADTNYVHLHDTLAKARKLVELAIWNHIVATDYVYELSPSNRTINWNATQFYFNRPVIEGFSADLFKLQSLVTSSRVFSTHYCTCGFGQNPLIVGCPHLYLNDIPRFSVLFSVDTIYYVFKDIIRLARDHPNLRQYHVLHIPKKTGKHRMVNDEATVMYDEMTNQMTMEVRGNESTYIHDMYMTADEPFIVLKKDLLADETFYLNFVSLETIDTGATIYGLYKVTLDRKPALPAGKRLVEHICPEYIPKPQDIQLKELNKELPKNKDVIIDELLSESNKDEKEIIEELLTTRNGCSLNFDTMDIPLVKGTYSYMRNGNLCTIKVASSESATMILPTRNVDGLEHKKLISFNPSVVNIAIKGVVQESLKYKNEQVSRVHMQTNVRRALANAVNTNTDVDLVGEYYNLVFDKARISIASIMTMTSDSILDSLLGENTANNYPLIIAMIVLLLDVLQCYFIHNSFVMNILYYIILFLVSFSFGTHLSICGALIILFFGTYIIYNKMSESQKEQIIQIYKNNTNINLKKNFTYVCFILFIVVGSLASCGQLAKSKDTDYLVDNILNNCERTKYPEGLIIHKLTASKDVIKKIRKVRQLVHPDVSKYSSSASAEVNNCLDLYTSCVTEYSCFMYVSFNEAIYKLSFFMILALYIYTTAMIYFYIFVTSHFLTLCIYLLYFPFIAAIKIIDLLSIVIEKIKKNKMLQFSAALLTSAIVIAHVPGVKANSIIESSCIGDITTILRKDKTTKWNVLTPEKKSLKFGKSALCNCVEMDFKKKKMLKMLEIEDKNQGLLYHSCWANNIAALYRNCIASPKPNKTILQEFSTWFEKIYDTEILPILLKTQICEIAWYNRLTADKQNQVAVYFKDLLDLPKRNVSKLDIPECLDYQNFVKIEKQHSQDSKTRCICSPSAVYKYITGPVTYALEKAFVEFKGYGAPKTWGDQEKEIDRYANEIGYDTTIQLDGKGFDMTQDHDIKKIVDVKIYQGLANLGKITHVEADLFLAVITPEFRRIKPSAIVNKKPVTYGSVTVRGRTFSGSTDTTLMNTIRMNLYNRFALERKQIVNYDIWVKGDDTVIFLHDFERNKAEKALMEIFLSEKQYLEDQTVTYGLGQIAKFLKTGGLIDFDFCSTMLINTQRGYKILRKLTNIRDKEHYSVNALQMPLQIYHNDLNMASKSWLGTNRTSLHDYFDRLHPIMENPEFISKQGRVKDFLPGSEIKYDDALVKYDYEVQKERHSLRNFTECELTDSLSNMVDNEQLLAYYHISERLDDLSSNSLV